jgi:hypothetical protein
MGKEFVDFIKKANLHRSRHRRRDQVRRGRLHPLPDVKAYNRHMARRDEAEPATEVGLLTEIRDLLAQRQP